MCPLCIGVATWYVAGASSAGGITALVLGRSSDRNRRERSNLPGNDHGQGDPRGPEAAPLAGGAKPAPPRHLPDLQ